MNKQQALKILRIYLDYPATTEERQEIARALEALDDTYGSWTNRETWAMSLYCHNDGELYQYFTDFADEIRAARFDFPVHAMAGKLKDWWESQQELLVSGSCHRDTAMALTDIGSLWRVNWEEVAKSFLEVEG